MNHQTEKCSDSRNRPERGFDAETRALSIRHVGWFKFTMICLVPLVAAATVTVRSSEPDRILNLKDLTPRFARASGKGLHLNITNPPPALLALTKPEPAPLRKRDSFQRGRKIQVLFGKDVIGFAEVVGVSRGPLSATGTNAAKTMLTSVVLKFDTEEQAAKAAEALRLPELTPKPLPRPKTER
jgi:hypothetical protein